VRAGSEISPLYDPMVAKLIVHDTDREAATRRMLRALAEFEIEGVRTLLPFHGAILSSEQWARAETCRDLLEDRDWLKRLAFPKRSGKAEGDDEPEPVERTYTVEVSGRRFEVTVHGDAIAPPNGTVPAARRPPRRESQARRPAASTRSGDELISPLQGNVFKLLVERGATVEEGALICIIEAMKMENEITAHKAGVIAELPIAEGAAVSSGDLLAVIRSE
jgi:acetyl-CoA/propionyl-CoA carboxylase biotin carboxyl carrier protein